MKVSSVEKYWRVCTFCLLLQSPIQFVPRAQAYGVNTYNKHTTWLPDSHLPRVRSSTAYGLMESPWRSRAERSFGAVTGSPPSYQAYFVLVIGAFLAYRALRLMGFFSAKNHFHLAEKVDAAFLNLCFLSDLLPIDCNHHRWFSRIGPVSGQASRFKGCERGNCCTRCAEA